MLKNPTLIYACGFLLAPTSILLMWIDIALPHHWLMLFLFFVVLPFVRWAIPLDLDGGFDETEIPSWLISVLYWLPSFFAVIWLISATLLPFYATVHGRPLAQNIELWVCIWIASSLTLPVCHELVHRSGIEAILARLLGAASGLIGFTEEHRVHHAKSGKGQDPDCADQNENVYVYALRSSVYALRASWDYEITQLMRKGKPAWANRILRASLVTLFYCLLWYFAQGQTGLFFYVSLALATQFSLRAITFIQHWGLKQVPLQTAGLGVSWVSSCIFQSWLIFNLALHEQHHHHPSRPYWRLRSEPTELKLPVTYPLSLLISLIPPIYRMVMAPRLAKWLEGIKTGNSVHLPEGCVIQ